MRDLIKKVREKLIHALGGWVTLEERKTVTVFTRELIEPVIVRSAVRGENVAEAVEMAKAEICRRIAMMLYDNKLVKYSVRPWPIDHRMCDIEGVIKIVPFTESERTASRNEVQVH